ncbi:MAG: hypothetical protein ACI9Y1_002642 [Lentisphaeria bacterium]|jgi:hypothetical protein
MTNALKHLGAAALFIGVSFAHADMTPQEKGLSIAQQVEANDRGWGNVSSSLKMVLTNRQGNTSERLLTIKTLEVPGDGDKSLTFFHEPKDVKGTSFLSFSHALEADQQWLYLPALKRVKRISSSNKSGPFLGSELAFEDIASFEVEKYEYEFLREDTINGEAYFVVKYIPNYKFSGYRHEEVWVHKEALRIDKTVYFDRKGALLKTFVISDWNKYLDKYWRGGLFEVVNHQNGKTTKIYWENYVFNNGDISENDFNQNTMKRMR